MKKTTNPLVLSGTILAVWAAGLYAQPIPTAVPPPAPPATNAVGAKIQFESTLYEFGRVKSGDPVRYTYNFTNTGDQLLTIKSVQPTCGCTVAGEWTKEVEPGKSGKIPIQFNSSGFSGQVFKQVTVTCNVTNQPVMYLQLKGTIFKPIDINPPFVSMNVPADAPSASAVVTITNNSDDFLVLESPQSNNKSLTATLVTNVPGKGFQLKIQTVEPLASGNAIAQITMKTSLSNMATLSMQVSLIVQPPLTVSPPRLAIQPGPLENGVTNSITIQNNSTNLLSLSDPRVNVPGVEVKLQEMDPGRKYAALVAFPPAFQLVAGQQAELTIKSSNPKMPLVKVPLTQPLQRVKPVAAQQIPPPAPVKALAPAAPPAAGAPAGAIKTATPAAPPPLPNGP